MDTKEIVYGMLTENTGTHFLDSGGSNGRMWQRNAKKTMQDFENESEQSYEFDFKYNEIYRTVSVFHYLTNNLEINDICEHFNKLQNENDNWNSDGDFYGVSLEAGNFLNSLEDVEIQRSWNTYNGDSDLCQILQGSNLTIDGDEYVLIQIHNGADARGGYTDAKLFKLEEYGIIHEYLREYLDSYELEEEMEYIDTFADYWDNSINYTNKEVQNRLKETNK